MLYHFLYPLKEHWFILNLFRYITFRTAYATITAFLICFLLGPYVIRLLKRIQGNGAIREDVPERHINKIGTPSMGGVFILFSIVVSVLLWADLTNRYILFALATTTVMGFIGFVDDYLKLIVKKPAGLGVRYKFPIEMLIGLTVGFILYFYPFSDGFSTVVTVPFFKEIVINLGILYILFVSLVIVGSANAVNLTDGLDGLAIGIIVFASIAYGGMAYVVGHIKFATYLQILFVKGTGELTVFMGAILGASIGFLWFNTYPAEVFMGDTGSLSLGTAIGTTAVLIKQELLLVIVGGVFVIEALSVMLQVVYFKLSGGRRLFKMSPIHHHFELKGIPEPKVIVRFWIVAAIFTILSLSTLKIR
ncbi:MAG TPA: phospho-N-acetylmuramoyl-pentapeptide-transferase [Firmicutes bacterium]|nr:phospho-N-acetylmuramoyl-pentapeptide-transferase [Bacillota bacterium]